MQSYFLVYGSWFINKYKSQSDTQNSSPNNTLTQCTTEVDFIKLLEVKLYARGWGVKTEMSENGDYWISWINGYISLVGFHAEIQLGQIYFFLKKWRIMVRKGHKG